METLDIHKKHLHPKGLSIAFICISKDAITTILILLFRIFYFQKVSEALGKMRNNSKCIINMSGQTPELFLYPCCNISRQILSLVVAF